MRKSPDILPRGFSFYSFKAFLPRNVKIMDPEKKELYTAKRASGVDVSDPLIAETWERVRSDESPENWMLLYLPSPLLASVKATGSSVEEFLANLTDEEVLFGAIRVLVDDAVKFYHVYFVGANVNGMKRGKASIIEGGVFLAMEGTHGKLQFGYGLSEISVERIAEEIKKVSRCQSVVFL